MNLLSDKKSLFITQNLLDSQLIRDLEVKPVRMSNDRKVYNQSDLQISFRFNGFEAPVEWLKALYG